MKYRTIKHKLTNRFLLIAGLVLLVSLVGIVGLLQILDNVQLYYSYADDRNVVGELLVQFNELESDYQMLLLYLGNPAKQQEKLQEINISSQKIDDLLTQSTTRSQRDMYTYFRTTYNDTWVPLSNQFLQSLKNGASKEEMDVLMLQMLEYSDTMQVSLNEIFETIDGELNDCLRRNNQLASGIILIFVVVAVTAVTSSIFIAIRSAEKISNPVKRMAQQAKVLASGNNSVDLNLDSHDEVGDLAEAFQQIADSMIHQADVLEHLAAGDYTVHASIRSEADVTNLAIERMIDSTNAAIGNIAVTSEHLSHTAVQIANEAQELASSTNQQAASIEEISQAIAEVDAKTKHNTAQARHANQINHSANTVFQDSLHSMQALLTAMEEIDVSSRNITKIIKVIEDIAFQTNILALNAAVEAARAGHQGKGFAVVADEVRNLASKSAKAAQETASLISNSAQRIQTGNLLVEETNAHLKQAIHNSTDSAHIIDTVAEASELQSLRISEISTYINEISKSVQNNSASSQELATASEQLSSQSSMMDTVVRRFRVRPGGSTHSLHPENRKGAGPANANTDKFALTDSDSKY